MGLIGLTALLVIFAAGVAPQAALAQGDAITLRVEAAVTGQLTAAQPSAMYTFFAQESLRMGVVFDVTEGDMQPTLLVLGQDGETLLAGSSGPNNNGLIVTFPSQGQYYLSLTADSGTSATYRLMIDADPQQPTDAFIAQSYVVSGLSVHCDENTPAAVLTPTEDLNVCFVPALLEGPTEFLAQWWSPSGTITLEEGGTLDTNANFQALLTGIVYQEGTPWEAGWWQVHFLLDGELHAIQWVPVVGP